MSFLTPDTAVAPMKTMFRLQEELRNNPERVEKTQALTRNPSKPTVGLSGKYGLFGSSEWWGSIAAEKIPIQRLAGVIVRSYVAGQDPVDINTVDIRMADGSIQAVGIYLNGRRDLPLFQVGHAVSIVYALDELKLQPSKDGGVNASKVALEMAVSVSPVAA